MSWRPEVADKPVWSAVGGVLTIVGATALPVLAPAHVPSWSIDLCASIGAIGFYIMITPLVPLWPWPGSGRPYVLISGAAALVVAIVLIGSGGAHSATRRPPSHKLTPTATRHSRLLRVPFNGRYFSVWMPKGWRSNEREIDQLGEKESTWVHVAEPRDTLLIDFSPSATFTLQEDAAKVHETVMKEPGSSESYYGVGDLANVKSWMWIFRRPGSERIDYFFNRCSTGFAVLGTTSSARFARMRPVFRAIAESVRPSCG